MGAPAEGLLKEVGVSLEEAGVRLSAAGGDPVPPQQGAHTSPS